MEPITILSKCLSSVGLLLDIIGAFLVAVEVARKYKCIKFTVGQTFDEMNDPPKETPEYVQWQKCNKIIMAVGLAFLLIGFSLQIISNWVY